MLKTFYFIHVFLNSSIQHLEGKIDTMEKDLKGKIETMEKDLKGKIDGIEKELHDSKDEITSINKKLEGITQTLKHITLFMKSKST